jgi:peptidase M20/M25/M40-like protein
MARFPSSDPAAPSLLLMGHTDVVPANPNGWQRDPHGAQLVDGWIWGRGAIDMLNITSSMAIATRCNPFRKRMQPGPVTTPRGWRPTEPPAVVSR